MVEAKRHSPTTAAEASEIIRELSAVEIRGSFGYKVGYRVSRPHWDWERLDQVLAEVGPLGGDMPDGWNEDVWEETKQISLQLSGKPRAESPSILSTSAMTGIVDFSPADQVVTVRAGTELKSLQEELGKHGQCLSLPNPEDHGLALAGGPGTVGGMISMNLPHGLESQCGSWRDWLLGIQVVLGTGTVVKSGSRVVKNVAGYDAMELFVGARGSLGLICEAILKTHAIEALPRCEATTKPDHQLSRPTWIQRTLPSNFGEALAVVGDSLIASDRGTSTLWANVASNSSSKRFPNDWVLRAGCRERNMRIEDPTQAKWMRRAKELLDPANKMNPGEMGIL